MNPNILEKSIRAAEMSLKVEGLEVSSECVGLCKMMLEGKISIDDYIQRVTPQKASQYCLTTGGA